MTGVLRGVTRCAAAALLVAGAAAILGALAAGTPWLMWHVTGWPLPRRVPSPADLEAGLTARESGRFILDVITCAGWACWAAFLAGVVLEAAWQIRQLPELARGRAGARRAARLREGAAGLSPPRALAAVLIGAVLVGVLAAMRGTGGALAGPAAPRLPVTLTSAVHASAPPGHAARASHRGHQGTGSARPHQSGRATRPAAHGPAAARSANQPVPAGEAAARASSAAPRAPGLAVPQPARPAPGGAAPPPVITLAARQHPPATAWYTVREGDNLWDIAAARLGDAEKWPEIYALNEGRPQPDGQDLTDPALIEPGWILRLPPAPGHRPGPGPARPVAPRPGSPPRPASPPLHHPRHPRAAGPLPASTATGTRTGRQPPVGWPRRRQPGRRGRRGAGDRRRSPAAPIPARARRSPPGWTPPGRPSRPRSPPCAAPPSPPPPAAATAEADDADAYFAGQDPGPDDPGPPAPGSGPALRDAAGDAGTTAAPASPPRRHPRRPRGRNHPA